MNPNREKTISIVQSHGCSTSNLIAILQDIQAACSYLSEESLTVVAEMLDVSVSSVYSVATFYENFSLGPPHHQGLRRYGMSRPQVRPDLRRHPRIPRPE